VLLIAVGARLDPDRAGDADEAATVGAVGAFLLRGVRKLVRASAAAVFCARKHVTTKKSLG